MKVTSFITILVAVLLWYDWPRGTVLGQQCGLPLEKISEEWLVGVISEVWFTTCNHYQPATYLRNQLSDHLPTTAIAMGYIDGALRSVIREILADRNYEKSFDFLRSWFDIGQIHDQLPSDLIFDAIMSNGLTNQIDPGCGKLIISTAHCALRFVSDVESDRILAPYHPGLQRRLCTSIQRKFFINNLVLVSDEGSNIANYFYADTNLIAHWVNLGYVEEAVIRDHILQSLISHSKLYDHQACALFILFKIAGATIAAYADLTIFDRCFELLKGHFSRSSPRGKLIQVSALPAERDVRTKP